MDEKELEALYKAMSEKFDIGDYNTFKSKMTTTDDRKRFYDAIGKQGFDLGDYNEYEKRIGGVKKKASIDFGKSSLDYGNTLSQSPSPLPLAEEGSLEENPITLSRQARELQNKTIPIATTNTGSSFGMGTTGETVYEPDQEAVKQSKILKEQFKTQYEVDPDEFFDEIRELPDYVYKNKSFTPEELIAVKKANPQNYQRRIATATVQSGLRASINKQFSDGNITEDQRDQLLHNSKTHTDVYGIGGFSHQQNIAKKQAAIINLWGGENKDKLMRALAIERSKVYGDAYKEGLDNVLKDVPEKQYLNNEALLGYQYLKDLSPEKAKQYERLFIDPKTLKDKPDAQSGYNHLMQTLEETGINLQLNAINEDLNTLNQTAKNNGGYLNQEQLDLANKLEKKQDELFKKSNELDNKYPNRLRNKIDDAMQEILGQDISWFEYAGGKTGVAFKNTAQGIWESVSSPFMSEESNNMRELAIMGEKLFEGFVYHKTDKSKGLLTDKLVIDPKLQKQIDVIVNDKSLNRSQKKEKLYPLLKENKDQFGRVSIKGGKYNVNPSSILYGVTDIGTTLLPFIALEAVTGGGATAGAARKFLSTFTAAAATSFHDEYANALLEGKPQSEAYKHALASTAISSLAMAGAGTPEAIKRMAGLKTSAGKIINQMADAEISALMKKTPKALRGIAERIKATPNMIKEGIKTGTQFEGFMNMANEAKSTLLDTPIDREENFKHSLLNILNFGVLGAGLGHAGYKSPTELQKGAYLETGKNPTEYIDRANQMVKDGDLSTMDFEQIKNNIESAAAAYKNLPVVDANGSPLTEKQKADYLYNEAVKNEALKKQLPPRQKEKAEHTALVSDFKNDYILEPKTDKQLEARKNQLEKSLEPKKDAEGKTIEPNEKEVKESKAELEAVKDIIENKPKEEDTKLSEPIEELDEQGIPLGENVPKPTNIKIENEAKTEIPENTLQAESKGIVNTKVGEVEQPTKEERSINKDNKLEYITKTGNQKVRFENEDLIVLNTKTGEEVSDKTKKKAIREYADNFDYTIGELSTEMPIGITSDNDAKLHIIETSQNPYEIAEIYISEEPTTQPLSNIERMIADFGIGKVKGDSYNNFGDRNKMSFSKAKNYLNKQGGSIDVIAKEMSDYYEVEINPEDIINFIDRFPNGERQALKLVESNIAIKAANKFKELTGLNLNNEIAEKAINQQFNKLSKQEQSIAKQDYETKQQLEEAYWAAHEETNGFTKESPNNKAEQAGSGEGGKKPPVEPPKEGEDAMGAGGNGGDKRGLDKMAANMPNQGVVREYMSKDTIEKYTNETPQNNQEIIKQELLPALLHGEKVIEKSKEVFGEDYVEKLLDYVGKENLPIPNKALIYISLENALAKEKLESLNVERINKLQKLVYEKSQAFSRENSLALNMARLRKIAEVGYDTNKITDSFFSSKELEKKSDIEKALESDADTINKEAEIKDIENEQADLDKNTQIEKLVEEGVAKEIDKIYKALPTERRKKADKAITALESIQKKLRGKLYDAGLGVPVAIIDAGITTIKNAIKAGVKIADAVELGIKKIKEKYGKKWEKEDEFRKDLLKGFEEKKVDVKENDKSVKQIVKEALIDAGFSRTTTIKGEKRKILDWKKLAGEEKSIDKMKENVEKVLSDKGMSKEEIQEMQKSLVKEYDDLLYSIVEKSMNELARRNKETVTPEQKGAAKKLAELYNYGLFDKDTAEYDKLINTAIGSSVSPEGFEQAKKIATAMQTLYTSTFKGVKLNDNSSKAALHQLENNLRVLLSKEAKMQGNNNFKMANIVRNYMDISQTMVLNNLKQTVENPFSGAIQNAFEKISGELSKEGIGTKEMSKHRSAMMKTVYKDMLLNGGIGYGDVNHQFANRAKLDDYVNKLSDNQLYQGIASVLTGKATLDAMDSMFKQSITEKKFANNLIKILTHETNKNRMPKDEAIKFVSEKLTGQTFKDAQVTAKEVIEKINKDAGEELVSTTQTSIDRLANDIVKSALEIGEKLTTDQINAAYKAAYKAAGEGLGHEANNPLSAMVTGYTGSIENKIQEAVKEKDWNRAAYLTYKSSIWRNMVNPFVGGGTNWLVLKLEKAGLGLFTGLGYQLASGGKRSRIDLSSEAGQKHLERALYNQARFKDKYMRGVIGGGASLLSYLAFLGIANTDDYSKWRAKNKWSKRYLDTFTPEFLLAQMAAKEDKLKQYFSGIMNKNDAFDASTMALKAVEYAAKGDKDRMWGALGEVGSAKFNFPLPWRLVKDGQVLYQGVTGKDPYNADYSPSTGFANGIFKGGVIEWLGLRPKVSANSEIERKAILELKKETQEENMTDEQREAKAQKESEKEIQNAKERELIEQEKEKLRKKLKN